MKNYRRLIAALLTLTVTLLMTCIPSAAQVPSKEVHGRVIRVTDGDTVTLLDTENTRIKIRLAGIDAPESKMPYGHAAQTHLAGLILNKQVMAVVHKLDRYGRTVATVWIGSKDINLTMVQAGLAWHYKQYEAEQPVVQALEYAQAERVARTAALGLWSQVNPAPPWSWRKTRRGGVPVRGVRVKYVFMQIHSNDVLTNLHEPWPQSASKRLLRVAA